MIRWCWLLLGCLLPAIGIAEEKLGRLFLTPAERTVLDNLRQISPAPGRVADADEHDAENGGRDGDAEAGPTSRTVSVGGFVKRSDGKTTVWVNGRPLDERTSNGNVELGKLKKDSNRVPIKLPNTGEVIELKPGQVYDPASGRVLDGLKNSPAIGSPQGQPGNIGKLPQEQDKPEASTLQPKEPPAPAPSAESVD